MRRRAKTVRLRQGDVRALRVFRGKRAGRLAVYDEDEEVPLIQATLDVEEQKELWRALGRGK